MEGEPSQNDRYSDELLAAVRYLLTVADPVKEGQYGSDFNRLTAEPSETLSIVRHNAYAALENCEEPTEPIIPEDRLFIQVEERIQRQRSTRLTGEFRIWRNISRCAAIVASISAGGLFWTEGVLWAGMFFGCLFLLCGLPSAVVAWRKLGETRGVLRRIEHILS